MRLAAAWMPTSRLCNGRMACQLPFTHRPRRWRSRSGRRTEATGRFGPAPFSSHAKLERVRIWLRCHVIERRQQMGPEISIVFDHRKMPHPFHYGETRPWNGGGHRLGHRRRARIVIFASEQRDFAAVGIDALDVVTSVPIHAVEVNIALIDPW